MTGRAETRRCTWAAYILLLNLTHVQIDGGLSHQVTHAHDCKVEDEGPGGATVQPDLLWGWRDSRIPLWRLTVGRGHSCLNKRLLLVSSRYLFVFRSRCCHYCFSWRNLLEQHIPQMLSVYPHRVG